MPRILLIDDDEDVRRLLADVLTSVGHDVNSANDGHQAVSSFRAAPADLVVTDLTMNGPQSRQFSPSRRLPTR
jgi:two-component system, NtrC family, response regulator HydG